jgi:hypothetical protein
MNPRRRTGEAAVRAAAVSDDMDGTIASSSGSATVAPRPRRNVRRGSVRLVMIIGMSSSEKAGS